MIGIISIYGEDPQSTESTQLSGPVLPGNLAETAGWNFVTKPVQTVEGPPAIPESGAVVQDRVLAIRKHLREGLSFLKVQEKGLHEAINAVEGVGQLVSRRDQGLFPRVPESQLQEEFEILRIQLDGIRQRSHFNKPLYGNGATPPLRIHTSLWDIPRHEEVSAADLEALPRRLIYWGKVSGEGPQAVIRQETVHMALRHLLEIALKNQAEQDRLLRVLESLSEALGGNHSAEGSDTKIVPQQPVAEPVALEEAGPTEPDHLLDRIRAWVRQFLPGQQADSCNDKISHHNQDAIT